MPAAKTKVVPFSAATPEDPGRGGIPLAPGLDAPPPFLSTPAAYGPEPVSIPPALQTPAAPAPQEDPFAGFPRAETDPFAGFPRAETDSSAGPTSDASDAFAGFPRAVGSRASSEIKSTDFSALVSDKDFRPVEWLSIPENEQAAINDPELLQKIQDVYTEKYKKSDGAVKGFVKAIPSIPKSAVQVAKGLASAVAEPFAVAGRAAGKASAGDFRGAIGEVQAAPQGLISAATKDANLLYKVGRGLKEVVSGPETPDDFRSRLLLDAQLKRQENEAARGNSDVAKALKIDTTSLAEKGITVNPESIEKLSVITDPLNFIPIGAAVGVVGKAGKFVVATTAGAEIAEKVAKGLNAAARAPGQLATSLVGKGAEKLGEVATKAATSRVTDPALRAAGGLTGLIFGGGLAGAFVGERIGRAVSRSLKPAGKALTVAGVATKEAAPVVGNIVGEGIKGAAEAAALTFPLTIGASDEEREALMGNIGLAAGLRGGGASVKIGLRATRDKVAANLYKSVERAATPDSSAYGSDPTLDAAHQEQVGKLGDSAKNVVNYFREWLRPTGIEIYALDGPSFVSHVDPTGRGVAATAKGFRAEQVMRINPDGTQTPVNRILLNGSADGISHELFHAFDALDKEGSAALKKEIDKTWSAAEKKEWADTYNSALNGGKPESQWTHKISDEELLNEAAAEIFGRVLDATDLSGVKPNTQRMVSKFMAGVLEKAGFYGQGVGKAGAGVSELGIRASTKQHAAAQEMIGNIANRLKENGVLGDRPDVPLTELKPGDISGTPAPFKEAAPQAFPPPDTAAEIIPISVEAPRNIRTTPEKQDFATKRAEVTNTEAATAAAAQLSPETQKVVADVNSAVEAGQTAFEVEHRGVKSASTPDQPSTRKPRRTEQEEAYIKESEGALPADVRDLHQKVTSFVRWEMTKDGTPQFVGYSLDKAIANIEHLIRWSDEKGVKIPYAAGPEAWKAIVQDLKDYYKNQAHGYRGDGEKLVRPTEDIQVSLPPEDPNYKPVKLSTEKTQFLNAAQGTQLAVPLTVREQKGKIPGNIKAQLINELQGRTPEAPASVRPSNVKKQKFKTKIEGRAFSIAEVNPLRNEMAKAGVPVRELIEVTERLNADDLAAAKPRPDLDIKPGVTDIIRGGFLPSKLEEVSTHATDLLHASGPEFEAAMKAAPDGLTGQAWRLGMGLESPESLEVLQKSADLARDLKTAAMKNRDLDLGFSYASRAQYFREAYEAATGTGSAGEALKKKLGEDYKPPFPQKEPAGNLLPGAVTSPKEVTVTIKSDGSIVMTGAPADHKESGALEKLKSRIKKLLSPKAAEQEPWWIPKDKPAEEKKSTSPAKTRKVDPFREVEAAAVRQERVAGELKGFSKKVLASPQLVEGKWLTSKTP